MCTHHLKCEKHVAPEAEFADLQIEVADGRVGFIADADATENQSWSGRLDVVRIK